LGNKKKRTPQERSAPINESLIIDAIRVESERRQKAQDEEENEDRKGKANHDRQMLRVTQGLLVATMLTGIAALYQAHVSSVSVKVATDSLEASIASSRLDLRPLVVLSKMELSEEPRVGRPISASGLIINVGKTAAIKAYTRSTVAFWSNSLPQPIPTDLSTAPHRNSEIIAPGGVGNTHFYITSKNILNAEQIAEYRSGASSIYLFARVDYEDVFTGSKPHWTNICVRFTAGHTNEFAWCESQNDMDQEQTR
jgi:hypothetical protein